MLCSDIISACKTRFNLDDDADGLLLMAISAALVSVPQIKKQLAVQDNKELATFDSPVKRIKYVCDNGEKIPFTIVDGKLVTGRDNTEVTYYTYQTNLTAQTAIKANVPLDVLVIGVIAEYYIASCRYDEGGMLLNRYESELKKLQFSSGGKLPNRWLL